MPVVVGVGFIQSMIPELVVAGVSFIQSLIQEPIVAGVSFIQSLIRDLVVVGVGVRWCSTAPSYVADMLQKMPSHTRNTCSCYYTMPLLSRPVRSKASLGDQSFSFAYSV